MTKIALHAGSGTHSQGGAYDGGATPGSVCGALYVVVIRLASRVGGVDARLRERRAPLTTRIVA
jgi:hypothetical protein